MGTVIGTYWLDDMYCIHCSKYRGKDNKTKYVVAIHRGNKDKFDTITTLEGYHLLDLVYQATVKYERKKERWEAYYKKKQ